MKPLIKITTEPLQMVRYTQNARLVSSGSVDIERRKAIARQTMQRSTSKASPISIDDVRRINRTFSKKTIATPAQNQENSFQKIAYRQAAQRPAPVPAPAQTVSSSNMGDDVAAPVVSAAVSDTVQDVSVENSTAYTAERGSFEMRVARGDMTYLPPLVMTIITQRPQVHVEYLGGFNYVPPRDEPGGSVNLFT